LLPAPIYSNALQLAGCLAVFASAISFYLATTVIRWSKTQVALHPSFFVFSRFLMGFIIILLVLWARKRRPKPRRYHYLLGRTLANCIAVYCFYTAVDVTSLASANILNMTYPLFIALFTWLFFRQQRDVAAVLMVGLAFIGVFLILAPAGTGWQAGNLWGLASGIMASFAIIYLNVSRQYHDSETILFYMFGLGTIIIYLLFYDHIYFPDPQEGYYLLLCSFFGIGGQYLLTVGFRFVTAVEGSIISSSRILLAALLGPFLPSDPPLVLSGWFGALLIFAANAYLAVKKINSR
jgi:drug/metabolite transporter (DMT)-like permease